MPAFLPLPGPVLPTTRLVRLVGALILGLLISLVGPVGLGSPAHAATATVTGRFVTDMGAPVDAIRAIVFDDDGIFTEVISRADGTFEITGIPPGSYTFAGSDLFFNYSTPTGQTLELADGETEALGDIELDYSSAIPPGTRMTGTVRDPAGKPVRGIRMYVRTPAPLFSGSTIVASEVTDRNGRYNVQPTGPMVDGSYKIHFHDDETLPEPFRFGDRYSGDQPTWARATTVTVGSTQAVVPSVTVTRNGGISGTLTGTVPMTGGTVTVFSSDGEQVATKATGTGGAYTVATLRPGTYYVRFSSTDAVGFIRTWWPGAASILGATPVTVTSGIARPGVDQVLSDQLTAFRKPAIGGRPVVGATLTAAPGSWSLTSGTEYSYEWLRGTAVVGIARTYRPVAADAGRTLIVRVTARNLDKTGTSTSAPTATVKWVSTVTAGASYTRSTRRLRLTVRVAVPGLADPGGTVTVREGSRTVKAGVAVRNGTAVVVVIRPKAGLHTYALRYSGTAKVLADTGSVRVRVPR